MSALFAVLLLLADAPAPPKPPPPAPAPAPASTPAPAAVRRIQVTARKFEFSPSTIELELGVPVVIELRSLDRAHGFSVPELGVAAEIPAGGTVAVSLTPAKAGRFEFHCNVFCGSGHEEMTGELVVKPAR